MFQMLLLEQNITRKQEVKKKIINLIEFIVNNNKNSKYKIG